MNLESAASTLVRGDNKKYFVKVYKHYDKDGKSSLKDYLEFIDSGMYDWFMLLPKDISAKATFSKPKTAILNVLKDTTVIESLGQSYCEDFSTRLSNFYRTKGDEILNKRTKENNIQLKAKDIEVSSDEETDPIPIPISKQEPSQDYEALQKKYNDLSIEHEKLKKAFESIINLYVK
jgi:hypothetical protein